MRRLIFVAVICLVVCVCFAGCDEEKKPDQTNTNSNISADVNTNEENKNTETNDNNNTQTNKNNNAQTNQNEEPVYVDDDIVLDDEIIELDDSPNQAPEPDIIVTKIDPSAEGLVFAYFQKKDMQLTFGDVLTDYTTDFTTIRRAGGRQRTAFLGFKLDENNRIVRAYACGIYKGTLFALEGSIDGETYESNRAIMNRIYAGVEIIDRGYNYYVSLDDTQADVWNDGRTEVFGDAGAQIDSYGKIYCD